MKALFLGFALTLTILCSTFAQAADQQTTKLIGDCVMTKASILKSKDLKTGSIATNEIVRFTVTHNQYENPEYKHYEVVKMEFLSLISKSCPTLGCEYSTVANKGDDLSIDSPMISTIKVKANDAQNIDITFKGESYKWTRLTYNFSKRIGTYESRVKINDFGGIFGIHTTTNDHFVREIRDCNFAGPINLDPHQP